MFNIELKIFDCDGKNVLNAGVSAPKSWFALHVLSIRVASRENALKDRSRLKKIWRKNNMFMNSFNNARLIFNTFG